MKVSIITVVYNSVDTISASIQSVLDQDYNDIEYIVIDGQSTDGTVDVIRQYSKDIDVFVSEKDNGLYDALNKGIALASGEIVGILHADDLFGSNQVISEVVATYRQKNVDCVYGDLVYVDRVHTDTVIRTWKSGMYEPESFLKGWMPPHPTFFVKRECFQQNGLYDTDFTNSADYELMLRYLYKNKLEAAYIDKTLVRMRVGGLSSGSLKSRLRANKEDMLAWKKNNLQPKPYTHVMKPLRKLRQFSLRHFGYRSTASLSLALPLFMGFFKDISILPANLMYLKVALSMIFAWGIVALSVPAVVKIAELKRLMADPNARSSHQLPVPTLGGVAIYAALLLSLTIWGAISQFDGLQYVIGALTLTFFTGLKDDMLVIAPGKKLTSQLLASGLIILGADLHLESFYGILGIGAIPYWFSLPFTLFIFVVITNAYNLIDGIDGLASTLGIIAASLFGVWFMVAGQTNYAILAFSMVGALVGFIRYNFSKKQKIFLGDTGSLIIGLLCATMALQFIKMNGHVVNTHYYLHNAPLIAMAVLSIPLFDTLRVFIVRIYRKQSPFYADRNHIHHLLIDINFSHKSATLVLGIMNILLVGVAVSLFVFLVPTAAFLLTVLGFLLHLVFCHQLQFMKSKSIAQFFMHYLPPVYTVFWQKSSKN